MKKIKAKYSYDDSILINEGSFKSKEMAYASLGREIISEIVKNKDYILFKEYSDISGFDRCAFDGYGKVISAELFILSVDDVKDILELTKNIKHALPLGEKWIADRLIQKLNIENNGNAR